MKKFEDTKLENNGRINNWKVKKKKAKIIKKAIKRTD